MKTKIGVTFSKRNGNGNDYIIFSRNGIKIENEINLHPFSGNPAGLLKLMPLGLNGGFCKYGLGNSNGR